MFTEETDASSAVLTDENIQKHIQNLIKNVDIECETEFVRDCCINNLKNDIDYYKAKKRVIFAPSPLSYQDTAALLDEHYSELEPFIDETIKRAKKEIPESEEKSITIPYTVLECAAYAIQYADKDISLIEAVKQNLYSEILKEISYLQGTAKNFL
jgi:hypothetical protein